MTDRAVRIAAATRSVTAVIIPNDVQEEPYEEPPREHGSVFSGGTLSAPVIRPNDDELQRAAEILNAGRKPAILIGQGARNAAAEVEETADLLGCGVARALNGRDVLPDDLPFVTGSIGLLGSKPSHEMISGCDTLLMIGSGFPYAEWLPEPGQARGVQIDIDARMLGTRTRWSQPLGRRARDAARPDPAAAAQPDRGWREEIEAGVAAWWETLREEAHIDADPVNPQRLFWELSDFLPDGAIVTADSGSSTNWFARHLRLRAGMRAALSGTLATMGPAIPYAVAAKFAYPDRPVIASRATARCR